MATPRKPKDDGLHNLPDKSAVGEWVLKALKAAESNPIEMRAAAIELDTAVERFAADVERGLAALRGSIAKVIDLTGTKAEAAEPGKDLSKLPITADTCVTVAVPRTLANALEPHLPKVLVRPWANKISRRQGSGFSDTVTVRGKDEVTAFLRLLYARRSPSGWYTLATRVINDSETMIRRQASLGNGKGAATRK